MEFTEEQMTELAKEYGTRGGAKIRSAVDRLESMTAEQRMTVFRQFCKFCGGSDPDCHCWNDQ